MYGFRRSSEFCNIGSIQNLQQFRGEFIVQQILTATQPVFSGGQIRFPFFCFGWLLGHSLRTLTGQPFLDDFVNFRLGKQLAAALIAVFRWLRVGLLFAVLIGNNFVNV